MDLDDKKENIQPLRGGRNVEQLEYAFVSAEQWEEERKAHEKEIDGYDGDDPLLPWYEYFFWMEQTNVSNFKPTIQEQALRRCVQLYENDSRYMQDHRFIKLCIKYIDAQTSPLELYNELYLRGVGTLCAELYIAWAYYYDAVDNFTKTEEVFQKGLRAGAEPKADLEQAHKLFGFSMSQRLLHKDECSKLKFQTSLNERRNALTSLRTTRKKHVGSIRTGLAVKSYQPGIVNQENVNRNGESGSNNAPASAIVFTDDATSAETGSSIVRPFSSVHSEPENIIEAARLAKTNSSTSSHKKPSLFGTHQSPSFDIPVDKEEFHPIPVLVDNGLKGVTLSAQFCCRNKPQTPFEVGICVGDPKERAIPMYDKIRLYCRAKEVKSGGSKMTEYSPEELRAYGYFVRRGIENRFTKECAKVWGRGYEVGIRLHPLHVPESRSNETGDVGFENPKLGEVDQNIQTKITHIYSNPGEEKSIEELLVERWLKGKINKCIDRRYQDDIDPIDMDETHVESKRISMGPARFSMAPSSSMPHDSNNQIRQRKSIFPTHQPTGVVAASIQEETEEELRNKSVLADGRAQLEPMARGMNGAPSRKRLSNDVLEQEVCKKEDSTPTPLKAAITNYCAEKQPNRDRNSPDSPPPAPVVSKKIEIFVDDSDENDERDELAANFKPPNELPPQQQQEQQQSYYPNDTCSTQMFNLFVKNISTPVAPIRKESPDHSAAIAAAKRTVVFADDEDEEGHGKAAAGSGDAMQKESMAATPVAIPGAVINDENAVPLVDHSTPPSVSSGCNSTQSHKQLSTIMERTETSTASSSTAGGGVTKSPVDTQAHSPEDDNISRFPSESLSKFAFREPAEQPAKTPVFTLPGDDGKGFCIHVDSTETMANIPLKRLPAVAAAVQSDDKENELITRATGAAIPTATGTARPGIFQLSDEPTFSGFGFVATSGGYTKNVSQMVQRELEANSIASFRLGTERTNTVPIQLVKPQYTIAEIGTPPASFTSSVESTTTSTASTVLAAATSQSTGTAHICSTQPSRRGRPETEEKQQRLKRQMKKEKRKECSFNLSDLIKSPQQKSKPGTTGLSQNCQNALEPIAVPSLPPCHDLSLLPMAQIKIEKSLNIDASLALPSFHFSEAAKSVSTAGKMVTPVKRIILDEFPSPLPPAGPGERVSLEDINTMAFSLNINNAVNSTIIQDGFKTPSKQCPTFQKPKQSEFRIVDVKGGVSKSCGIIMPPPAPVEAQKQQPPIRRISPIGDSNEDDDNADRDVSIYHPRPAISQDVERWEEVEEQFDDQQSNEYQHKPIDMDGTLQQINAHLVLDDIDPFERQLQEAFLDRVDFLGYIAELPTCLMVNKVQPLRKDGLVEKKEEGVAFKVQQKIGKGTYGTVYCAMEEPAGKKVAMKQERPANLWEYYICLELRSRIENPDILPGFMPIDYAIIGNNASIFVSPYSRYGNILDVCNLINSVTNRNMDEFIAMLLSAQILSIVDHLHSCQIIHADIKPDNFLLMGPIEMNTKIPCIQLIDFGVSIDMKLFPENAKFKKVITTDGFTCIEMLENKHWTYQPDLYGVAATSHVMLFGKYMQVQKNVVNWSIKTAMPRYFKKVVWENYFTTLLNIRDCEHLPNLQQLRTAFLEEVTMHEKYIQTKVAEFNHVLATCK
uniref:BUB1 N-terminal domain-containing protein n=1 Tax=Anopheles christyi TaxID=43041 RepID=A0A182JXY1_9DIPT